MRKRNEIAVFNYFDYREYLQAVYDQRKRSDSGYSHRRFSLDAGISSSNYLFRVLKGERSLSNDYAAKFSHALHHTQNESRYFAVLVEFNAEKDVSKKEALLRTLLTLRYRKGIHTIEDTKLKFFGKWYYPVIRELAVILDFKNDFNLLARNCVPGITAQQAENAVTFLCKAGFLTKDHEKYHRSDPVISSGDQVKSTILRKYHKQTLTQCIVALETVNSNDRDISSLTMSVSRKTFAAIQEEIQDFRKRLLAMAQEDTNPEIVCLAGFQLIPRSKMQKANKHAEDPQ